jgi:SAM-dependent methyltransferase
MSDDFELELLSTMPNYYAWIMEMFTPFVAGHVIEYGAGIGTISRMLEPLAERLTLVEPSRKFARDLASKFADNSKVEVVCETLEQYTADTAPASFQTIVLVNVLEHIERDRQALADLLRSLRPDGHLLLFVPAMPALMSKLDLAYGHYRRYSRTELVDKVRDAGGRLKTCRYFDMFGILPWFVLNKVMGATTFNPRLVRVNDRFVVPISRWLEQVMPPPVGKNVILVAAREPDRLP